MPIKKQIKKAEKEIEKLRGNAVNVIKLDDVKKKVEKLGESATTKIFKQDRRKLTIGQKTADWLTKWAGSWFFIAIFALFLIFWMLINTYFWTIYQYSNKPFDAYPFILLNLILSCLAAIQAPIILMSQNRSNQRDRMRAEYDYQVNRKAEKEVQEIKKQLDRIEKKLR